MPWLKLRMSILTLCVTSCLVEKVSSYIYYAQVEARDMEKYSEYFKPDGEVELKALGISADVSSEC